MWEVRVDEVTPDHFRAGSPSLTAAVRQARVEEAERSDAVAELRGAEIARLEMLQDAIRPVLGQVPDHVDLFDAGIVPGERPRLFIDMIGFVEMGRDRKTYRFLQDTRHGRVTIIESDRLDTIRRAVAGYVARRLVEREKALAADHTIEEVVRQCMGEAAAGPSAPASKRRRFGSIFLEGFVHLIEYLGLVALLILLIAGGYQLYHWARPLFALRHGLPRG
jgi:hypothetical protein